MYSPDEHEFNLLLDTLALRSQERYFSSLDFICKKTSLRTSWPFITKYEKISKTELSDVIDISTLTIIENNGHLKKIRRSEFGKKLTTYFVQSEEEIQIQEKVKTFVENGKFLQECPKRKGKLKLPNKQGINPSNTKYCHTSVTSGNKMRIKKFPRYFLRRKELRNRMKRCKSNFVQSNNNLEQKRKYFARNKKLLVDSKNSSSPSPSFSNFILKPCYVVIEKLKINDSIQQMNVDHDLSYAKKTQGSAVSEVANKVCDENFTVEKIQTKKVTNSLRTLSGKRKFQSLNVELSEISNVGKKPFAECLETLIHRNSHLTIAQNSTSTEINKLCSFPIIECNIGEERNSDCYQNYVHKKNFARLQPIGANYDVTQPKKKFCCSSTDLGKESNVNKGIVLHGTKETEETFSISQVESIDDTLDKSTYVDFSKKNIKLHNYEERNSVNALQEENPVLSLLQYKSSDMYKDQLCKMKIRSTNGKCYLLNSNPLNKYNFIRKIKKNNCENNNTTDKSVFHNSQINLPNKSNNIHLNSSTFLRNERNQETVSKMALSFIEHTPNKQMKGDFIKYILGVMPLRHKSAKKIRKDKNHFDTLSHNEPNDVNYLKTITNEKITQNIKNDLQDLVTEYECDHFSENPFLNIKPSEINNSKRNFLAKFSPSECLTFHSNNETNGMTSCAEKVLSFDDTSTSVGDTIIPKRIFEDSAIPKLDFAPYPDCQSEAKQYQKDMHVLNERSNNIYPEASSRKFISYNSSNENIKRFGKPCLNELYETHNNEKVILNCAEIKDDSTNRFSAKSLFPLVSPLKQGSVLSETFIKRKLRTSANSYPFLTNFDNVIKPSVKPAQQCKTGLHNCSSPAEGEQLSLKELRIAAIKNKKYLSFPELAIHRKNNFVTLTNIKYRPDIG